MDAYHVYENEPAVHGETYDRRYDEIITDSQPKPPTEIQHVNIEQQNGMLFATQAKKY